MKIFVTILLLLLISKLNAQVSNKSLKSAGSLIVMPPQKSSDTIRFHCPTSYTFKSRQPLVIIDGKRKKFDDIQKLNPENIEKVEASKGREAIKKYGRKAKDGVLIITLKKQ